MAFLEQYSWHPAVQNAYGLLSKAGLNPYAMGGRSSSGYNAGGSESSSYAPGSSSSYSPYGYPAAPTDPGTGRVRGGAGMENVPGWAGRQGYSGSSLGELVYNPSLVLPDVMGKQGATGPVGQMMQDLPYDPRTIYMLTAGNKKGSADAGLAGYANWLGQDFYPGAASGKMLDYGQLTNALEDPRKNSALGMMMEQAGPVGQTNLFQQYLYDIAYATMGPDVAEALVGMGQDAAMMAGNKALGMKGNSNFKPTRQMGNYLGF